MPGRECSCECEAATATHTLLTATAGRRKGAFCWAAARMSAKPPCRMSNLPSAQPSAVGTSSAVRFGVLLSVDGIGPIKAEKDHSKRLGTAASHCGPWHGASKWRCWQLAAMPSYARRRLRRACRHRDRAHPLAPWPGRSQRDASKTTGGARSHPLDEELLRLFTTEDLSCGRTGSVGRSSSASSISAAPRPTAPSSWRCMCRRSWYKCRVYAGTTLRRACDSSRKRFCAGSLASA